MVTDQVHGIEVIVAFILVIVNQGHAILVLKKIELFSQVPCHDNNVLNPFSPQEFNLALN